MGAAVRDLLGQAGTLLLQSLPGRSPGGGSDPGSLSAGTAEPEPYQQLYRAAVQGLAVYHSAESLLRPAPPGSKGEAAAQHLFPRWTQWKPPVCWLCSPRKSGGCSPCAIQRATMPARSVSCSVSRPARSAAALPRYAIASKLNLRRIK